MTGQMNQPVDGDPLVLSGGPAAGRAAMSHGARLGELAAERPSTPAIVFVSRSGAETSVTWLDLERESNRAAQHLWALGGTQGSFVAVVLPNSIAHYIVALAAWKIGACVVPLNPLSPEPERAALLELAKPGLVIDDWEVFAGGIEAFPATRLPDIASQPGLAIGTGGSTGRPKIVVDPNPWARVPGVIAWLEAWAGLAVDQVQLVAGPLYHNAPFNWSHRGLFQGNRLIVMEHFDAALAVDLIERHAVNFAFVVPTMMARIARLSDIRRRDLSSIQSIFHSGASCPAWVKREWIELIGGRRVREAFGGTEIVGCTVIDGDEWLEHPGSVGKPFATDMLILDETGLDVPPGEVGEIFMRRRDVTGPTYEYLGAPPARAARDGYQSLGDLGWIDADGYLHIADRRVDMIVTGGANVYPAEVEAALSEHPGVVDVAVIGLPHADWGRAVHAIVQPADIDDPPEITDLEQHMRARVAPYKAPKSYEFVAALPRNEAGKLRRAELARERGA